MCIKKPRSDTNEEGESCVRAICFPNYYLLQLCWNGGRIWFVSFQNLFYCISYQLGHGSLEGVGSSCGAQQEREGMNGKEHGRNDGQESRNRPSHVAMDDDLPTSRCRQVERMRFQVAASRKGCVDSGDLPTRHRRYPHGRSSCVLRCACISLIWLALMTTQVTHQEDA